MKSSQIKVLSKETIKEFGALLLLDHLMRYELLVVEKVELDEIIVQFENDVKDLKKGFFRTDEQEQELTFIKEELICFKVSLGKNDTVMIEGARSRFIIAILDSFSKSLIERIPRTIAWALSFIA